FESSLGAGTIIEQEQDPGGDLDGEEKERHAAKVVPDRLAVNWDFLFLGHGRERADRKALVKPICQGFYFHERPRVVFSLAQAFTPGNADGKRSAGPLQRALKFGFSH